MKHKVENSEIEIDARGLECPIPVLKARKLSQTLSNGSIVKVICTDPLAEMDFKHYCQQSNFKYNVKKIPVPSNNGTNQEELPKY